MQVPPVLLGEVIEGGERLPVALEATGRVGEFGEAADERAAQSGGLVVRRRGDQLPQQ